MNAVKKTILIFLFLFSLGLFLSLNINSKYKVHTYKSTMWADASGYFMYLPSTFIYHWDYEQIPKKMDSLTGHGFYLRDSQKVVFTKYTSGIAYLQFPFFIGTHAFCKLFQLDASGFSQPYVNSILFAGVFYLLLGLFFLYYFLSTHFDKKSSLFTCIAILACTNLYYYGIEHPGLSHIYSFFIASLSLFLISKKKLKSILYLIPLFALLILIRPTNLLLVFFILSYFFHQYNLIDLKSIKWNQWIAAFLIGFFIVIPQMFYWHYASGNWISYSYKGEGFTNWNSPKILEVLFAACNGFLTYAPLFLLAFWGYFYKPISASFSLKFFILFSILVYINASWWSWQFGCAYGGRAFVDYYPFLAIGLASFVNRIILNHLKTQIIGLALLLIFASYNLLFIYGFDDCWYSTNWDYAEILNILKG